MTRANLNYLPNNSKGNRSLYIYHNGDQYPIGLRDWFHVDEFLDSDWSPKAFKAWIKKNYSEDKYIAKTRVISHPAIYYDTWGNIADYSYVFDHSLGGHKVLAYNWGDKIFSGNAEEFKAWLKEQK